MKRIMLVVLLAMLAIANVAAVSIEAPEGLTEEQSKNIPVTLNISATPDGENHINIGFSSEQDLDDKLSSSNNALGAYTPVTASEVTIHNVNGVGSLDDTPLYIYWILGTSSPLDIKLYVPGELSITGDPEKKINWTVTWDADETLGSAAGSIGGAGNYDETNANLVYSFTGESFGAQGAVPLKIETDELEGATPGEYTGNITLLVQPAEI